MRTRNCARIPSTDVRRMESALCAASMLGWSCRRKRRDISRFMCTPTNGQSGACRRTHQKGGGTDRTRAQFWKRLVAAGGRGNTHAEPHALPTDTIRVYIALLGRSSSMGSEDRSVVRPPTFEARHDGRSLPNSTTAVSLERIMDDPSWKICARRGRSRDATRFAYVEWVSATYPVLV